jgi:hypothetical protein
MKKSIISITCIMLIISSAYSADDQEKYKNQVSYSSDWSQTLGFGPDDAISASLGTSMLGWGLGMAIVIGLASVLIHSGSGSTSHAHSSN